MAWDVSWFGYPNGVGQQPTASIPAISNPAWNPGHPCHERRLERVLQQNREIEMLGA
jgi:hypothetical protein